MAFRGTTSLSLWTSLCMEKDLENTSGNPLCYPRSPTTNPSVTGNGDHAGETFGGPQQRKMRSTLATECDVLGQPGQSVWATRRSALGNARYDVTRGSCVLGNQRNQLRRGASGSGNRIATQCTWLGQPGHGHRGGIECWSSGLESGSSQRTAVGQSTSVESLTQPVQWGHERSPSVSYTEGLRAILANFSRGSWLRHSCRANG
jgi:hypothetical protein